MLITNIIFVVLGLAAVIRSYTMLMGTDTPQGRRKNADRIYYLGLASTVVAAFNIGVWVLG